MVHASGAPLAGSVVHCRRSAESHHSRGREIHPKSEAPGGTPRQSDTSLADAGSITFSKRNPTRQPRSAARSSRTNSAERRKRPPRAPRCPASAPIWEKSWQGGAATSRTTHSPAASARLISAATFSTVSPVKSPRCWSHGRRWAARRLQSPTPGPPPGCRRGPPGWPPPPQLHQRGRSAYICRGRAPAQLPAPLLPPASPGSGRVPPPRPGWDHRLSSAQSCRPGCWPDSPRARHAGFQPPPPLPRLASDCGCAWRGSLCSLSARCAASGTASLGAVRGRSGAEGRPPGNDGRRASGGLYPSLVLCFAEGRGRERMSRNAAWSFMISAVTSSNVLRRRICIARRREDASQYSVIASSWEGRCRAFDVHHWAYSAAPFSVATPVRVRCRR